MSTQTAKRKRSSRHRWKPRHYGPPKALTLFLILFVLFGGILYGIWYATREVPHAAAKGNRAAIETRPMIRLAFSSSHILGRSPG